MVARFGGQTGSAVLFPYVGGAGLGTLASLGGDGMLVFLAELFSLQSGISGMPSRDESSATFGVEDLSVIHCDDTSVSDARGDASVDKAAAGDTADGIDIDIEKKFLYISDKTWCSRHQDIRAWCGCSFGLQASRLGVCDLDDGR